MEQKKGNLRKTTGAWRYKKVYTTKWKGDGKGPERGGPFEGESVSGPVRKTKP